MQRVGSGPRHDIAASSLTHFRVAGLRSQVSGGRTTFTQGEAGNRIVCCGHVLMVTGVGHWGIGLSGASRSAFGGRLQVPAAVSCYAPCPRANLSTGQLTLSRSGQLANCSTGQLRASRVFFILSPLTEETKLTRVGILWRARRSRQALRIAARRASWSDTEATTSTTTVWPVRG